MRVIGNLIWLLCGGLISALGFAVAGVLMCLTIVLIPLGIQSFKMAEITLHPFGAEVYYAGGAGSFLLNVLWIVFIGFWEALLYALVGGVLCLTIVGIPFGLQFFKLAKLFLAPFGAEVRYA